MSYSFSSKKFLVTLIAGVSTLLITSTTAFADEMDSGVYINLNAGLGGGGSSKYSAGGVASSINVGYNFNHYLAVDAGINNVTGAFFFGGSSSNIYTLSAKGSLPLGEVFYLYGRLGLGYNNSHYGSLWSGNNEYNEAVALIAAGAAFHLGKHFELHLENSYFSPLNNQPTASTINALQLGLQYNF